MLTFEACQDTIDASSLHRHTYMFFSGINYRLRSVKVMHGYTPRPFILSEVQYMYRTYSSSSVTSVFQTHKDNLFLLMKNKIIIRGFIFNFIFFFSLYQKSSCCDELRRLYCCQGTFSVLSYIAVCFNAFVTICTSLHFHLLCLPVSF